jgi:hypothetical protein
MAGTTRPIEFFTIHVGTHPCKCWWVDVDGVSAEGKAMFFEVFDQHKRGLCRRRRTGRTEVDTRCCAEGLMFVKWAFYGYFSSSLLGDTEGVEKEAA